MNETNTTTKPAPLYTVPAWVKVREPKPAEPKTNTHTPATWRADLTPAQAERLAHQAAGTMLKSEPPAPIVLQLKAYAYADKHHDPQAIAELVAAYTEEHDNAAELARISRKNALALSDTDMDAAADATAAYTQATATRDAARANAEEATAALLEYTANNYTDIFRAALVQYYATLKTPAEPTAAKLARDYGLTPDEWNSKTTEDGEPLNPALIDEIQSRANYSSMIKAARDYMRKLAHGDALDSYHTDRRPATPEQVTAWANLYGIEIPAAASPTGYDILGAHALKGGQWEEMRYCDATKKRPAGWYYIHHRRTVKTAQRMEELTAAGYDPAADVAGADEAAALADVADYVQTVIDFAKLTDRQREYLTAYRSDEAAKAAHRAQSEYMAHVQKWNSERRQAWHTVGETVRRQYGATAAGYTAGSAESHAYARIITALKAAAGEVGKYAPVKLSTGEAAQITAAFNNRRPVRLANDPPRPDMVQAVAAQSANINTAPTVDFITAEELNAHRAAAEARHAADLAQQYKSRRPIDNTTEAAQAAAQLAAIRYKVRKVTNYTPEQVDRLTPGEMSEILRRYRKGQQAKAAKAAKAKRRAAAEEIRKETERRQELNRIKKYNQHYDRIMSRKG